MESSEWSTNSKSSKLSASLCGLCGFSPPFNLIASAMSTDSRWGVITCFGDMQNLA